MSGTAIPQSDAALLAAQAKAGQAGLDAYEAAKAEMSANRSNAISGALSAAQSRGVPNAAMQSTLAGAEQVYNNRQASLTGAEAAYKDAMASRSQRAQDYQGAIQGARSLISDQVAQSVAPIRAQSEFQINQLRQSGENRVSEINANQALDMSRMAAESAARQQQYDLDLARYQEEKRLELERYQEQMRLEAERFERLNPTNLSDEPELESITSEADLKATLQNAALADLRASNQLAGSLQQDSLDAFNEAKIYHGYTPSSMPNEPMLARHGLGSTFINPVEVMSQPRASIPHERLMQPGTLYDPFTDMSSASTAPNIELQKTYNEAQGVRDAFTKSNDLANELSPLYDQQRIDYLRADFDNRVSSSEQANILGTVPDFNFDNPYGAQESYLMDVDALQRAYRQAANGMAEQYDFKNSSLMNAMSDGNFENPNDILSRSAGLGDTASQRADYEKQVAEDNAAFEKYQAEQEKTRQEDQKRNEDLLAEAKDEEERAIIQEQIYFFNQYTGTNATQIFGPGIDPGDAFDFVDTYQEEIDTVFNAVNSGETEEFDIIKWLESDAIEKYQMQLDLALSVTDNEGTPLLDLQNGDHQKVMQIILSKLIGYLE